MSDVSTFDSLAAPYDRGMLPLEKLILGSMRRRLLAVTAGRVLEIGIGTGANLPYYPRPSGELIAVDESADMLAVAAGKMAGPPAGRLLCQAIAESLPFPSDRFDSIVASLVLCSVVDVDRALGEVRRVLRKPAGQVLLLEHMRPRLRPLAWLVDLLDRPWYAMNGRCHLNRRTEQALGRAGLEARHVERRIGGLFRLIVAGPANDKAPSAEGAGTWRGNTGAGLL